MLIAFGAGIVEMLFFFLAVPSF
uniref:Uncharacterized protein n=1 Tax=Anguilla anguilla TaxID=7936 RepID=A0A0E9RZZ8_ANGAN